MMVLAEVLTPYALREWLHGGLGDRALTWHPSNHQQLRGFNWIHGYLKHVQPVWIHNWGTDAARCIIYCYHTEASPCTLVGYAFWLCCFIGVNHQRYWASMTFIDAVYWLDLCMEMIECNPREERP